MWSWILCTFFAVCGTQPGDLDRASPGWVDTAPVAVPLVAQWEGLRTEAYLDRIASPPVWTICYGETEGVEPGMTRTVAECEEGLRRGLERYWVGFRNSLNTQGVMALTVPVDAAFTSLTWNIGIGAVSGSTAVRRLRAEDLRGACEALTWWNRAGGRVVRGLVNRRADEHELCLEGVG